MATTVSTTTELQQFRDFLNHTLQVNPADARLPEELLDDWRHVHPSPEEYADSVAALRRAIASKEHDPGMSLEEFDRRFREQHPHLKNV